MKPLQLVPGRSVAEAPRTTSSSTDLHPIKDDPEVRRFILRRARRDRNPATGKMVIAEPLSAVERQTVSARLQHLAKGLAPAAPRLVTHAIQELFTGCAATETDDMGAAATEAQFVSVLKGLPYFAVKRACDRFARCEVKPEEVFEKHLSTTYRPSAGQVRIVAEKIVRPHWDEASVGSMLLDAEVRQRVEMRELTPAEREEMAARVKASAEDATRQLAQASIDQLERDANARVARDDEKARRHRDMLLAEYASRGLEPVYSDEANKTVVSVSMLLSLGWRIEDGPDGGSVLVKPSEVES